MIKLIPYILSLLGFLLSFGIYKFELNTIYSSTLAPFFQIIGKPIRTMNKALTKMIPVDSLDEKEYGDAIKLRYKETSETSSDDSLYLNSLIQKIEIHKKKPFDYEVFILKSSLPNAFAMPGGVIFVTEGLLDSLDSESQLVAVLAHEIGHIEKSHCMDAIRFELLTKKIGSDTLGALADFAFRFFMQSSYNKTQESEADDYAFSLLLMTDYHPMGESEAFLKLLSNQTTRDTSGPGKSNHPILEYFQSHPYLELRAEKFKAAAEREISLYPEKTYYIGKKNLRERKAYPETEYDDEFTNGRND
ncbi:MAG: M48 family metalloprotease [Leptospiraceae bacterium]|nr:M48 family metallopeptidase [Leptospiraceae bacterium]MCP5512838.1 M48 family metalloprotease [Leptospiraceae bacterium]